MRGGEVLLQLEGPALQRICMLPLLQSHSFDFQVHIGFRGRVARDDYASFFCSLRGV